MKGFNDDEINDFVEMTRDRNVDVRFIEYMPFDGNRWSGDKLVPYKSALEKIREKYPDVAKTCDGPNDTSKVNMQCMLCKNSLNAYFTKNPSFLWNCQQHNKKRSKR